MTCEARPYMAPVAVSATELSPYAKSEGIQSPSSWDGLGIRANVLFRVIGRYWDPASSIRGCVLGRLLS